MCRTFKVYHLEIMKQVSFGSNCALICIRSFLRCKTNPLEIRNVLRH